MPASSDPSYDSSPFSPLIQSTSVCLSFTSTPLFLARNTLAHEQQAHARPSSSAAPPRPLTPGSLPRASLPACGLTIATAYGMFKSSERERGREGGREGGREEREKERGGVLSHTPSIPPPQEHHAHARASRTLIEVEQLAINTVHNRPRQRLKHL